MKGRLRIVHVFHGDWGCHLLFSKVWDPARRALAAGYITAFYQKEKDFNK